MLVGFVCVKPTRVISSNLHHRLFSVNSFFFLQLFFIFLFFIVFHLFCFLFFSLKSSFFSILLLFLRILSAQFPSFILDSIIIWTKKIYSAPIRQPPLHRLPHPALLDSLDVLMLMLTHTCDCYASSLC